MRLRLHEVELFSQDSAASRTFYQDVLGLEVHHHQEGLNVFGSGWPGVDFDTSVHHPGKTRLGFVVDSLDAFLETLAGKDVKIAGPMKSHLGMKVVRLEDPDGNVVEVQEFTEETPAFLKGPFGG